MGGLYVLVEYQRQSVVAEMLRWGVERLKLVGEMVGAQAPRDGHGGFSGNVGGRMWGLWTSV